MASQAQTDANRQNSQNSTGPRSAEGKSASSRNAFRTGLYAAAETIRSETQQDYATLNDEYYADYHPQTAAERELIDILISCAFLLRRFRKIESHMFEKSFVSSEKYHDLNPRTFLGDAFINSSLSFSRLQRRINDTTREFHRTLEKTPRPPGRPPGRQPARVPRIRPRPRPATPSR